MTRVTIPVVAVLGLSLGACGTTVERLRQVGDVPPLSPIAIADARAPAHTAARADTTPRGNSLWQSGSRSFFRDPRASKRGDILTVNIDIVDQAKIANSSRRSRSASEDAEAPNFLGLESRLAGVLPDAVDPANLIGLGSESSNTGAGSVDRSEAIKLTVAAVVTDVLPNGNLVIQGQQEVRVNYELRELTVSGVVRPEDISNANTVKHTQIAEARISYGGRGQITDVQQPRLGQQLYDILFPF